MSSSESRSRIFVLFSHKLAIGETAAAAAVKCHETVTAHGFGGGGHKGVVDVSAEILAQE